MAVVNHFIEYGVQDAVPVSQVVESLLANERLVRHACLVLEELYPGLRVRAQLVSVSSISQESPLREWFASLLVVSYQDDLTETVPPLVADFLGTELLDGIVPDKYQELVTVLVMLGAIWGVSKAYTHLFPDRKSNNLDRENTRLINVAGDLVMVDPEHITRALEKAGEDKQAKGLRQAAQRFFAPARQERNVPISSQGGGATISAEAVQEAQSVYGYDDVEDETPEVPEPEFHSEVEIVIHAMDRDKGKTGWAGHIHNLFDKRSRMKLDKSIQPESLFGKAKILGDVLVEYAFNDEGEPEPVQFILLRVIE